jgi:methionine sulfoxide reductase heme-binding subunit
VLPSAHPHPLQRRLAQLRVLCFVLCLCPALLLAWWAWTGQLGPNAVETLLRSSGRWALGLLLVTLAVTPLRRLSMRLAQAVRARYGRRVSDWNLLIRLRRQLGLFSFFYASLHLACYVLLDAGGDALQLLHDLGERSFVQPGWLAWILLLPLAATSTQAAMRALGGRWRTLHRSVYLVAALGYLHLWWGAKPGQAAVWALSAALLLLLVARALAWRWGERQGPVEVEARTDR